MTPVECKVPTKAVLSHPLSRTGERQYKERLVSGDKDSERSLTSYHHHCHWFLIEMCQRSTSCGLKIKWHIWEQIADACHPLEVLLIYIHKYFILQYSSETLQIF